MMNQVDFENAVELENVEAATLDPGILLPKTKELVFLKKLSKYLNNEGDEAFIPKGLVTNEALAGFLLELGVTHEYKPHFKKTALAAISYLIRVHCMPSIFDFKRLYPNVHNALAVSFDVVLLYASCNIYVCFICRNGERN